MNTNTVFSMNTMTTIMLVVMTISSTVAAESSDDIMVRRRATSHDDRQHATGARSRAHPFNSLIGRTPSKSRMDAKYNHKSGHSHGEGSGRGRPGRNSARPPLNEPDPIREPPQIFPAFSWPQCSERQICSNGEYDENLDCFITGCSEGEGDCDDDGSTWCDAYTRYCYDSTTDSCTQPEQSCLNSETPCPDGQTCVTGFGFECGPRVCKTPNGVGQRNGGDKGRCLFSNSCMTDDDCPDTHTCVSEFADCLFEFDAPTNVEGISPFPFFQCDNDPVCKNGPFEEEKDCDFTPCAGNDTCYGDVFCDGGVSLCYDPSTDTCTKPEYNCYEVTKPCPIGQKCVSEFSDECYDKPVSDVDIIISAFFWPQCSNDTKCTNDEYDETRDCSLYDEDYCGEGNECNYDDFCDANIYYCHDVETGLCTKPEYSCNRDDTPCPTGSECVNQFSSSCGESRFCKVQSGEEGTGQCLFSQSCQNDDDCGRNQDCVGLMYCIQQ
jgi:hypothetical protein